VILEVDELLEARRAWGEALEARDAAAADGPPLLRALLVARVRRAAARLAEAEAAAIERGAGRVHLGGGIWIEFNAPGRAGGVDGSE
jgi:hypothetical protein